MAPHSHVVLAAHARRLAGACTVGESDANRNKTGSYDVGPGLEQRGVYGVGSSSAGACGRGEERKEQEEEEGQGDVRWSVNAANACLHDLLRCSTCDIRKIWMRSRRMIHIYIYAYTYIRKGESHARKVWVRSRKEGASVRG